MYNELTVNDSLIIDVIEVYLTSISCQKLLQLLFKISIRDITNSLLNSLLHTLSGFIMFSKYLTQLLNDIKAIIILNEAFHNIKVSQYFIISLNSFIRRVFKDFFNDIRRELLHRELHKMRL